MDAFEVVTLAVLGSIPRRHLITGACSRESKLPPKQSHRVRILAPLLMPVWLDTERRRTRNAVDVGANPTAGSEPIGPIGLIGPIGPVRVRPWSVPDARDFAKVVDQVRFLAG